MSMLNNKFGETYAEALKEALILKRNDAIPPAIDNELGHLLYSVTQWAIAEAVKAGKLWRTFSQDPDFQSDVLLSVVNHSNNVDLSRNAKEILIYLKRVGRSAIRDKIIYSNRHKRQGELLGLEGVIMEANFYGEAIGHAREIETNTGDRTCP